MGPPREVGERLRARVREELDLPISVGIGPVKMVAKIAGDLPKDHLMVMNMCGRGDKDVFAVARLLGIEVSQ